MQIPPQKKKNQQAYHPGFQLFVTGKMTRKKHLQLTALDDLDNEKRVRILSIIDNIRELGISENVSLPQVYAGLRSSSRIFNT